MVFYEFLLVNIVPHQVLLSFIVIVLDSGIFLLFKLFWRSLNDLLRMDERALKASSEHISKHARKVIFKGELTVINSNNGHKT